MSNLLLLTKIDFMASFGIGKTKEKKDKKSSMSFKTILILVVILGLAFSSLYNFLFTSQFAEAGESMIYPYMLFAGFASMLTLSTSIYKVKSIFIGADYEMLSAMPVRKTEIIASKILSLYLIELLYTALVMIPNTVFLTAYSKNYWYILSGILSTILIPAVPMVVSSLLSMFIAMVADRYKFGNAITFALYACLFAAIFYISFTMSSSGLNEDGSMDLSGYMRMSSVMGWVNPSSMLMKLAFEKNYAFIFVYAIANILLSVLVVAFLSLFFDYVHTIITSAHGNNVYVEKALESSSQMKALFKNEAKRFFNSKYYFINSMTSGIAAILICGFAGYMFSPWSGKMDTESLISFFKNYSYGGFLVVAFMIGISTPACCAISIEGKNLYMLKSFPLDYRAYLKSKIWLSSLVLGVCAIIASLIFTFMVRGYWYNYIVSAVFSVLYVILVSILDLRINLKHYKLDWKNEQECCKNSRAAVYSMLVGWLIMLIAVSVTVGFSFINKFVAMGVILVGFMIPIVLFYRNTLKNAEESILRIE